MGPSDDTSESTEAALKNETDGASADDTIVAMNAEETLRAALEPMASIQLAVLFGSAAKGAARKASDLDVGVLLDPGVERSAALCVALERATGQRVDLVWLDAAPPLLRFEIARTGRVLVERVPYGWNDFRAHAMIDWWDWAPTARMMHAAMMSRLREEARPGQA